MATLELSNSTNDIDPTCKKYITQNGLMKEPALARWDATSIGARGWHWLRMTKLAKTNRNICLKEAMDQAKKDMKSYWLNYAQRKGCFKDNNYSLYSENNLNQLNKGCSDKAFKLATENLAYIETMTNIFNRRFLPMEEVVVAEQPIPTPLPKPKPKPPASPRRKLIGRVVNQAEIDELFKPCLEDNTGEEITFTQEVIEDVLEKQPEPCTNSSVDPACYQEVRSEQKKLRCENPYAAICSDPTDPQVAAADAAIKEYADLKRDSHRHNNRQRLYYEDVFTPQCMRDRQEEEAKLLAIVKNLSLNEARQAIQQNPIEGGIGRNKGYIPGYNKTRHNLDLLQLRGRYNDCGVPNNFFGKESYCNQIPYDLYPDMKSSCLEQLGEDTRNTAAAQHVRTQLNSQENRDKLERLFKEARDIFVEKFRKMGKLDLNKPEHQALIRYLDSTELIVGQKADDQSAFPEMNAWAINNQEKPKILFEAMIMLPEEIVLNIIFHEMGHLLSPRYATPDRVGGGYDTNDAILASDEFSDCFSHEHHPAMIGDRSHVEGFADNFAAILLEHKVESLPQPRRWNFLQASLADKCGDEFSNPEMLETARQKRSMIYQECEMQKKQCKNVKKLINDGNNANEDVCQQFENGTKFCGPHPLNTDRINEIFFANSELRKLVGCDEYPDIEGPKECTHDH